MAIRRSSRRFRGLGAAYHEALSSREEAVASGRTLMYRGARDRKGGALRGPSYFASNQAFAATYGPTTAYRLNLVRPYVANQEEWGRLFANSAFLSINDVVENIRRLSEEDRYERYANDEAGHEFDYDSVIFSLPSMITVFVVNAAQSSTVAREESKKEDKLPSELRHLRDKPVSQMTPEEVALMMAYFKR